MLEGSATKVIVGLDLQPESTGAIRLAAWLAETSNHADTLVGIHVLEEGYLRMALRYHHLKELVDGATKRAAEIVESVGASAYFSEVEVVQGDAAEKGLSGAYEHHHASAIVLGRQAPKEGRHMLRLGRVARRFLRHLPGPTFIVPPDYDPEVNSDGPVICTTNLTDASVHAASVAAALATRLGRSLVLVHAVPMPDDYAAHYLPEASLEKMKTDHQSSGEADLLAWAKSHGCNAAECVVVQGGVVDRLVEFARVRRACVLVTGSRRLSTFERVLLSSIGSQLAAMSPCPVAVVPPPAIKD